MKLRTAFLAGLAALALSPRDALASPLFELAGGTLGQGGFNASVTAPGAASTYFNPALLADSDQEFDVGLLVLSDQTSLTLDGRPGGDVPTLVGDRTLLDPRTHAPIPNYTMPTQWLEHGCSTGSCAGSPFAARPRQAAGTGQSTLSYTSIGLVSRVLDGFLVLGLHALVPNGDFTQLHSFYNDEREQFFSNSLHPELYSDRLTATSLAFGAGSRLSRHIAIGASFTLSLSNAAAASTYVSDPVDYKKLLLDNRVGVTTAVAPHFGATYTPIDRLRLSAALHTEQKLVLKTGISATLPSGTESRTTITEVHDFVPWMIILGGAYDVNPGAAHLVSVAWTMAYEAWSEYLDRHGQRPDSYGAQLAWKDVITGSLGVRYTHGPLRAFLDGSIRPSPVPLQVGRSNYVDNDRVGAALGVDYETRLFSRRFRFGIGGQAQRLIARHQAKQDALMVDEVPDGALDRNLQPVASARGLQTNNPGWPGFASDGWILGTSIWASLIY